MGRKRKVKLTVFLLSGLLVSIACRISNPISGLGKTLEKMFEGIARNISF